MAGDRIGIFQLQGIVERVLTHCFITFLLGSDVRIVRVDPLIEIVLLLVGQGCGLGVQGVETDFRHEFRIVIIRERKTGVGEIQAVALLVVADRDKLCHVSVGDVVHPRDILDELVAILHYHQFLAFHQPVLVKEDLVADACIVAVGPFVGAAEDYRVILRVVGVVGLVQGIDQLSPADPDDIAEAFRTEPEHVGCEKFLAIRVRRDEFPQTGGIVEDSRFLLLADHFRERAPDHSPE